jgi:EAL and modified HD-GYP domain-containing signal transduction protein
MIDAILDIPMDQVMGRLPLSTSMKDALVHGKGRLSDYLALSSSYEKGDWERVSALTDLLGLPFEVLPQRFKEAMNWANAFAGL